METLPPASPEQPQNSSQPEKKFSFWQPTRRDFIVGSSSATAGLAAGSLLTHRVETVQEREREKEVSEKFAGEQEAYKTLYDDMTFREILFVDDDGAPLGDPIEVKPVVLENHEAKVASISPGTLNAEGVIEGKINQDWLDWQRKELHKRMPKVKIDLKHSLPRQLNTIQVIRDAKKDLHDEGKIEAFMDIVRHYAHEPVPHDPDDLTHIEYVRKWFGYNRHFSHTVEQELKFIVPGLAAQESQYNEKALSKTGAEGIFQFEPGTRAGLGYSKADFELFSNQVEAVGRYFEEAHKFFKTHLKHELSHVQKEFFNGHDEDFEKYFYAPLLTNSYNSGPPRVAQVVRQFFEAYPDKHSFEHKAGLLYSDGFGYDLYAVMARKVASADGHLGVRGYGQDSSEYFSRAAALAELVADIG